MKKNGIAVIGRIAEDTELLDGQTVKTKILFEELKKDFPDRKVVCIDTYQYKKHFFSILFRTLKAFTECKYFFFFFSRNGRKFFFPVLTGINAFFHRELYHDVIGGALPDEAERSPALVRQLKRFKVNWVELPEMEQRLQELGIDNTEVLPNFKRLNILPASELVFPRTEPFLFTMFSRVIKEKGIETAAESIAEVNRRSGRRRVILYIYGPVEESYRKAFSEILDRFQECVFYKGCVPFDQSVHVLKNSFMLLFPSVYQGEGMPGTIIDAFSAGIPVIASNWHFNERLVREGVTGYCYDWRNSGLLTERICYAVEHPDEIFQMKKNCLQEAEKYTPEAVMKQISRHIL